MSIDLGRALADLAAITAERDALAAEVERWVDAHAVIAREACPACEAQAARSRLVDATAQIKRLADERDALRDVVRELRAARATSRLDLLTTERDALAAEVERWVDAHAVLAREVDELRRALSVDDLAAHGAARAEELAPRITAAMLAAYALGRDDEAAGNPVRTPLDIVENSLPADVPMSSDRGHDLREGIARSTPLTEAGEES